MSDKKIPDVYGARFNLGGLYSEKPLLLKWDYDTECWFDKEGNLDAEVCGLRVRPGHVTFTSASKEEVQIFIIGILTVGYIYASHFPNDNIIKALSHE